MLSTYLKPSTFGSDDALATELRRCLDFVGTARPADPDKTVLLPGDPERLTRDRRMAEGVPLPIGV